MSVPNDELAGMLHEAAIPDRTISAYITHDAAALYPHNYHSEKGVLVKVYGMRAGAEGIEIQTGYTGDLRWFQALAFQVGWDLCDGCHNRVSFCDCVPGGDEEYWGEGYVRGLGEPF